LTDAVFVGVDQQCEGLDARESGESDDVPCVAGGPRWLQERATMGDARCSSEWGKTLGNNQRPIERG
jgi:hypothetical protein